MLHSFDSRLDFESQVEVVWHSAVDSLLQFPQRSENGFLMQFPGGSCELASWVIGQLLLQLGFGDWTLVFGANDTDVRPELGWGGHEWLEYTAGDGQHYTLDATAHQFEWIPAPFFIRGPSPLRAIYTTSRREHLSSEMPAWFKHDLFARPLAHVRAQLLA